MGREGNKPYMKPHGQNIVGGEAQDMSVTKRTTIDENGKLNHILEYEEEEEDDFEFDTIVVQFDPNDEDIIICKGYKGDELAYQNAFRQRPLSFDPISAIGRGQTESLQGISDSPKSGGTESDEIPGDIATAFNTIGFSIVPTGDWWIDE